MSEVSYSYEVRIRPLLIWASMIMAPMAALLLLSSFNESLFFYLNENLLLWQGDIFWALLTNFGDGFFLFPLTMLLFRRNQQQLSVILAMIVLAIIINIPKQIIDASRPAGQLDIMLISVVGPLLKSNSIPSGHAGTAFLLAGLALIHLKRPVQVSVLVAMVLVCVSRIAVGAHWPFDVVIGAWLGLASAAIGSILANKFQAGFKTRIGFILLGCLSVVVLPGYDNGFQDFLIIRLFQYFLALMAGVIVLSELYDLYKEFWPSHEKRQIQYDLMTRISRKFFKFGLVGGSGFLVDLGIYTLFLSITGMSHDVARGCSYWFSASWNWFWNRTFTFSEVAKTERLRQWIKYLGMCVISFVPNWGVYYLLTSFVPFFTEYKLLALVAGVGSGMLFNFSIASLFIFSGNNMLSGKEVTKHES